MKRLAAKLLTNEMHYQWAGLVKAKNTFIAMTINLSVIIMLVCRTVLMLVDLGYLVPCESLCCKSKLMQ